MPRKIPFGSASLERQCFLSSFVMASCPQTVGRKAENLGDPSLSYFCLPRKSKHKNTHTKNDVKHLGMVFHLSSGFVLIDTV